MKIVFDSKHEGNATATVGFASSSISRIAIKDVLVGLNGSEDPRHAVPTFDFAKEIAAIYVKILAGQEPLGSEFEAVIFDDIESLYES